jgi:Flp pilus assembly pilin Flp
MNELVVQFIQALRLNRRKGQAMVEYALLAGLISVVAIAALTLIGQDVSNIYNAIAVALGNVPGA